jgi:hypothetical protein
MRGELARIKSYAADPLAYEARILLRGQGAIRVSASWKQIRGLRSVRTVGLWASRSMSWSASDIAPGRYYFVVVFDPENAIGAYRMHRSEFSI